MTPNKDEPWRPLPHRPKEEEAVGTGFARIYDPNKKRYKRFTDAQIKQAVEKTKNYTEAAELLGCTPSTVSYRMRRMGTRKIKGHGYAMPTSKGKRDTMSSKLMRATVTDLKAGIIELNQGNVQACYTMVQNAIMKLLEVHHQVSESMGMAKSLKRLVDRIVEEET